MNSKIWRNRLKNLKAYSVLSLFLILFANGVLIQRCASGTGKSSTGTSGVQTEIGMNKKDVDTIKNGIITARVLSASQNIITSREAGIITSRFQQPSLFSSSPFAPSINRGLKTKQNTYEHCECKADYRCNSSKLSGNSLTYYEVRSKNQVVKFESEDISSQSLKFYEGTCQNLPPRVCDTNNNLNYNFEENCTFTLSGYIIITETEEGFACLEPSVIYGNSTTIVINFSEIATGTGNYGFTLYYVYQGNLKKISCAISGTGNINISCDIYTGQGEGCSLTSCESLTVNTIPNCDFTKEGECKNSECESEIAKIFSEDLAKLTTSEKGENYCEKLNTSSGEVIRIEKSEKNWIYTISGEDKVEVKICGENSTVNLESCEIRNCVSEIRIPSQISDYEESLTEAKYKISIKYSDAQWNFNVRYDKINLKIYFSGEVTYQGTKYKIDGVVEADGKINMTISSEEFSANITIYQNSVSGDITYRGEKYKIKTENEKVKICNLGGVCI